MSDYECTITSDNMQPNTFIEVKLLGTDTGFKGIQIYQNKGPNVPQVPICPKIDYGSRGGFYDIDFTQYEKKVLDLFNNSSYHLNYN